MLFFEILGFCLGGLERDTPSEFLELLARIYRAAHGVASVACRIPKP